MDLKTLNSKRFLEYENSVLDSKRLVEVAGLIDRDDLKILDVGGASGLFLNELSKRSRFKLNLYNLEVDEFYRNKQANNEINFLKGSVLDNKLESEEFDIVTFGDVLHHLIGKNARETRKNQNEAIQEMLRITKKGGHLVFNEEVNKVKIFSLIIYILSKLANNLKINLPFFDAGKVVVFFLTPGEIANSVKAASVLNKVEVVKCYCDELKLLLRWKLTILMSRVGNINYTIKKLTD